jgi:hypothetical protein
MVKVLRSILAIFAGLFVGFVAVFVGEMLGHHLAPPPPGMDVHNTESMAEAMKSMHSGAFVAVLLAWSVGTFAGAWVASKIAIVGKLWHGMAIGVFFLAAGSHVLFTIPHPTWVVVIGLVEPLPVAYLGAWLATRSKPKPSPLDSEA